MNTPTEMNTPNVNMPTTTEIAIQQSRENVDFFRRQAEEKRAAQRTISLDLFMRLRQQLGAVQAERDLLKAEVERLKSDCAKRWKGEEGRGRCD